MAGKTDRRAQGNSLTGSGADQTRHVRVHIFGVVQGVGFRPFLFQLAGKHRLGGWVRNQSDGVELEVGGPPERVAAFLRDIPDRAPPLARILHVQVEELPYAVPGKTFRILESLGSDSRQTLVAPDVCTCKDCLEELFNPGDRRFRYPFINCTNCGPRYTIIRDIPYDRDKTTMASFTMCSRCRREYEDPQNRRFHAQPNACWDCGPQLWLEESDGSVAARGDWALKETVRRIWEGKIAAVKGLGGFHLAAQAACEQSVARLRGRKIREEKPFAVMFAAMGTITAYCHVSADEAALLQSPERPIVLLERKADLPAKFRDGRTIPPIAPLVAPGNRFLGAFLPYTPLHFLLFHGSPYEALVMTSGNRSDEPIVTDNEGARERLSGIADFFLFHDRPIHVRCDDSVAHTQRRRTRLVRRARGYAPAPVFLKESMPSVLGVGAELKSAVCLTRGRQALLSQHIGDLENLETLRSFEKTIAHLQRIFEIRPELVVHDLHPDYLSTRWARQQGLPCMAVQHHHAHIASVMAERKISGPVLGIALDGAGYGTDGTIWGGEMLWVEGDRMERLARMRRFRLAGGDQAVREPWRMALSALWSLDPEQPERTFADFFARWPADKARILLQMLRRGLHSPLTSSCGRLFDAVAALTGTRESISYEGQAAAELEQMLQPDDGVYRGKLVLSGDTWILDSLPMIAGIVQDIRQGHPPGIISARFHNGLVDLFKEAALRLREQTGLHRVALSGGVFQNRFLSEHLEDALTDCGMEIFVHEEAPPNDGCIALGQAYVGGCALRRRQKGEIERLSPQTGFRIGFL